MAEIKQQDLQEIKNPVFERFQSIIPEHGTTIGEARDYWDGVFKDNKSIEHNLDADLKDYFKDLQNNSECPDTIPDKPFDISDLKPRTPEENAKMREEFGELKSELKKQWEELNGRPWPKYDHDVYSSNGKLIRRAGSDYDAHHIQPLGMGGMNEASNITPLSAEVHYDKQGVHAPDSPYSRIDKAIGGSNND